MLSRFVALSVLASLGSFSAARPLSDATTPSPPLSKITFKNVADPYNFNRVDFHGDGQIIYVANVTVAGEPYEVQLDTGSADLWLDTSGAALKGATNTHVHGEIDYLDGSSASGDIYIAPATLGPFTVPAQAFINAPGSNAVNSNDRGLLGLGPASQSVVYQNLQPSNRNGNPLLDNIFAAYPNTPNYITFSLARSNLGITDGGVFTVGSVDAQYPGVTNQPKLAVHALNAWLVYMDGIKVNGNSYTGHGALQNIPGAPPDIQNKVTVVLDTGSSLGLVPQYYLDAIYQNIPGALQQYDGFAVYYIVPCNTKLDVSMIVDGAEFPIDPLDMTTLNFDNSGNVVCTSAFSTKPGLDDDEGLDFLLGDAFLRNVYALFGFGKLTAGRNGDTYIQLLSTTDKAAAAASFDAANQARIKQWVAQHGQYTPPRATL